MINLEKLIDDNELISKITSYLNLESQLNFFSCNKKLLKYTKEKLKDFLNILEIKNNLSEFSPIQDQINSLKMKYTEEQFNTQLRSSHYHN